MHRRPPLSRESRRRANDAANLARRRSAQDTEAFESSESDNEPLAVGRDVQPPPRNVIRLPRAMVMERGVRPATQRRCVYLRRVLNFTFICFLVLCAPLRKAYRSLRDALGRRCLVSSSSEREECEGGKRIISLPFTANSNTHFQTLIFQPIPQGFSESPSQWLEKNIKKQTCLSSLKAILPALTAPLCVAIISTWLGRIILIMSEPFPLLSLLHPSICYGLMAGVAFTLCLFSSIWKRVIEIFDVPLSAISRGRIRLTYCDRRIYTREYL